MSSGNDLETLARARFTNLTVAEVKICQAASNGELAYCGLTDDQNHPTNDPSKAGQWGVDRDIRAELIRWLCVTVKEHVDPSGIQVFGARIVGDLHLSHVTVQFPLAFACCQFSGEIVLEGAHTRTVSFVKTFLGSIFADGASREPFFCGMVRTAAENCGFRALKSKDNSTAAVAFWNAWAGRVVMAALQRSFLMGLLSMELSCYETDSAQLAR